MFLDLLVLIISSCLEANKIKNLIQLLLNSRESVLILFALLKDFQLLYKSGEPIWSEDKRKGISLNFMGKKNGRSCKLIAGPPV